MTAAVRTRSTSRYVEHVMGMPISLALRGRHTDDAAARGAWGAVMDTLRDVDAVFSTYRPDSCISRLDRGEIAVDECPPEVAEVLALGAAAERESGGAFGLRAQPHHLGHLGRALLEPDLAPAQPRDGGVGAIGAEHPVDLPEGAHDVGPRSARDGVVAVPAPEGQADRHAHDVLDVPGRVERRRAHSPALSSALCSDWR